MNSKNKNLVCMAIEKQMRVLLIKIEIHNFYICEKLLPQGKPIDGKVYDFTDKKLGKAIPYGVYDITKNKGFVSVGIDHDTAEFAVETIYRWWNGVDRKEYPFSTNLYIFF